MANNTFICPEHGPYDASYGSCPKCSSRPLEPSSSLDEDDMLTDPGGGAYNYGSGSDDDEPTQYGDFPSSGGGYGGGFDSEDATEIPGGRSPVFDPDDEDPTELGRASRAADITELDEAVLPLGLLGILWVKEGRRRGHIHKIKDGTTIGRDDGDVYLEDPKVSNPHAKFTIEDDEFIIWDFGSRNGTHVNGERIMAATHLEENDEIKMGDSVFVIKVLETGNKRKKSTRKTSTSRKSSTRPTKKKN